MMNGTFSNLRNDGPDRYHAPTGLPMSRSYGATHITLLRGYYYPYHAPTELPAQRSYGATHITSRWDCSFFDRNLLP